ncbi:MAG TPA: hypothetical protein VJX68_03610 [Candidatus Binatus sp.]|nr:hypothetical protein [Candidatus Binatus sp.]HKN12261.1 hypothetical protein [Candidatus Binatus sp.]
MMNRKPAYDDVEFAVLERQARLDVALLEADVGESALGAHLLGNLERRVGQVDADDFATDRRKRHRDVPRPGRDFQHARASRRRDNLDQLAQMLRVANRGRGGVIISLSCEFFADQIFVFHFFFFSVQVTIVAVPASESSGQPAVLRHSRRLHG